METRYAEENAIKPAKPVNAMNNDLYQMLKKSAEADLAKAKLSLVLLDENAVGIGDHSTKDFYDNAEESLSLMADAMDRIEALEMFRQDQEDKHYPVFCTKPKSK